ncbi:MAG TPA: L-threonylcarbamoyladenylate synthase [Bryobacteraceae bacterium]|nr:L-threonylcarbamoyladenylate synthase [Bryobacteraceae bacterium]
MAKTEKRTCLSEAGEIRRAAALIRAGELVAFPTETVYGLGANALDAAAVERIYAAKGRPPSSPLIVHVDSIELARSLVREWPEKAEVLARRFWPGPLTLVLPKRPHIPDRLTAGLDTVGIRMPAHPIALALIKEAGLPLAAPSANRFAQLSPTTAEHVRAGLGDRVAMILDGGRTTLGIESTVLSLAAPGAVLLRPGMISRAQIEEMIGPIEVQRSAADGAHPAPGMHARHYSPGTPLVLVESGRLPSSGRGAYLWRECPAEAARSIRMPQEPGAYAGVLYEILHQADTEGWDWIAVERPPQDPSWDAIRDRLERAATR